MPSENNPREGFLKSYIKRKGKKCNGRDISVLTPSANNKRDFCTGFAIFLLLDYEFSNKSLEFALLYRKKEEKKVKSISQKEM